MDLLFIFYLFSFPWQNCATEAIQLLDTETNIIDHQFLQSYSLEQYLDERNKNCRTRGQKQKNLLFTFKMIGDGASQPMEIPDDTWNDTSDEHGVPVHASSPHSSSMDLDANGVASMQMTNDVQKDAPPIVLEDSEMSDPVEMMNADEPSMYTIPVKFVEADSKSEYMVKEYKRNKTMDRIVEEFVKIHQLNINNLVFTKEDANFLHIERRPLELYVDCDQTEMVIYFKVEEQQSRTSKRATSRDQSKTSTNQRQKPRVYLTFKDQTASRDQVEVDFDETDEFSLAIKGIAEVMDLDPSKSHFFDSDGMFYSLVFPQQPESYQLNVYRDEYAVRFLCHTGVEITGFKGTVAQYLKEHSANVEYKVIDRSTLHVQEVNSKGIANGVHPIPINKSTTIGQICDTYGSKHAQVVKMKDGLIQGVVARDTKAAKLVNDGYAYRIDLYPTSAYSKSDDDMFHVCVKFIGDSSADRRQTPLLVKLKKGDTLNTVGMKVIGNLGMTNIRAANDFQYSIDDKFMKKEHILDGPEDPESIPVVLLNMNENRTRQPKFSYRNPLKK